MTPDNDLQWLRSQRPKDDLLNIQTDRVPPVYNLIALSQKHEWPMTIGLFGSWGAGKTCFLSYLLEVLENATYQNENYDIVYFNAWKYAGFMEVVPALIYKLLKNTNNETNNEEVLTKVLLSLGSRYSEKLGNWAEKCFGVDPVKLAKDIHGVTNDIQEAALNKEVLDKYYTQIDQAQDLLAEHYKNRTAPVIVLIDELDRCDPGEAFDVIKQLRVFFSMREIPIIFVLSANPDPIGLAVKHQYGLESEDNDYEAKRILEKFVDSYIDLSDPIILGDFVKSVWGGHYIENLSTIHSLDRHWAPNDYNKSTLKSADIFASITTNNFLYSNLRVLQKSYSYVIYQKYHKTNLHWTCWHLEILNQVDLKLRRRVSTLASEFGEIVAQSHFDTFRLLKEKQAINNAGQVVENQILETNKGSTAFSIYRSIFWEKTKNKTQHLKADDSIRSNEKAAAFESILRDRHKMDFLVIMSLMPVAHDEAGFLADIGSDRYIDSHWREEPRFKEFSQLLSSF